MLAFRLSESCLPAPSLSTSLHRVFPCPGIESVCVLAASLSTTWHQDCSGPYIESIHVIAQRLSLSLHPICPHPGIESLCALALGLYISWRVCPSEVLPRRLKSTNKKRMLLLAASLSTCWHLDCPSPASLHRVCPRHCTESVHVLAPSLSASRHRV